MRSTIWLRVYLAILILGLCVISPAWAGRVESVESTLRRFESLERELTELQNHPVYEEQREIRAKISRLRGEIRRAYQTSSRSQLPYLRDKLYHLTAELEEINREVAKIDERRRALVDSKQFFPKTRNKVAVFTFEDPDGTGLGNALSFLISNHMLFSTRVGPYGIVNFHSDLSTRDESGLTYFDKVEKLTDGQAYSIAVWGRISDLGETIEVTTFAQLPTGRISERYARTLYLPRSAHDRAAKLRVKLTPDRFLIQTLRVRKQVVPEFKSAARQVKRLRSQPRMEAPERQALPEGKVYTITRSDGDWVRLSVRGGASGWTSVRAFCREACGQLLSAADFANDVVAYGAGKTPRKPAQSTARQALAIHDQLIAMRALSKQPDRSVELAQSWLKKGQKNDLRTRPPGGAAFANLLGVAQLAQASRSGSPPDSLVREVTRVLAKASLDDPTNLEVLRNLSELFGYIGDEERQSLANEIAATIAIQ